MSDAYEAAERPIAGYCDLHGDTRSVVVVLHDVCLPQVLRPRHYGLRRLRHGAPLFMSHTHDI